MTETTVSVRMSEQTLHVLRWISQQRGISMTEALALAVDMGGYIIMSMEGSRVFIEDKDGTTREILPQ